MRNGVQQVAPQLPTLGEFAAMPQPAPAPNTGPLPGAPGQEGAANNAARARANAAQRFVANAATAGVGQPIVVDEADAAAMRRPRRTDNIEVIDGLNRAIIDSTKMIGEALLRASASRGDRAVAAAGGSGGRDGNLDSELESLHKRLKFAVEAGDQRSISHCERMIRFLEEKEAREMEGGDAIVP